MAKEDIADTGAFSLADPDPGTTNGAPRPLRRRSGLPGGRAVVGGFLVALAALGSFAAWSTTTAGPRHAYVVARRSIPVGQRITAADLARQPLELPGRFPAFRDPADVLGAVALGPLRPGELLQPGNVARRPGAEAGGSRLSFSVEPARALNGDVRPGDRIDLLATYGDTEAYTLAVLRRVLVVDVDEDASALGQRSEIVLTLAIPDPADVLAATHAIRAGNLTIVRSGPTAIADEPRIYSPSAGETRS